MSLHVAQGEFISLLGPSGCGKTTTLRMIAGFETPSAGQIVLNGVDISHTPTNKRNIGMVFQSYALFPNMTVADNIGFGLRVSGTDRQAIASRVTEMLQLIDLAGYGRTLPASTFGRTANNASRWRVHWPDNHRFCSLMNRYRHLMPKFAIVCAKKFAPSNASSASRRSM